MLHFSLSRRSALDSFKAQEVRIYNIIHSFFDLPHSGLSNDGKDRLQRKF